MTKKFLLLACASTFFAAVNCFSQGVAFDSLKANAGTDKALIFTPVANYGHKIYGFDAGGRTDLRFACRANTPIWTDIMSITSVGNVGIGTNSPTERLTLNGNILMQPGNYLGIYLSDNFTYNTKTQPHYGMQWVTDSWSGAGPTWWVSGYGGLKFFSAGALRMAINDAGNVGIGTAGPVVKLSVYGANNNDGAMSFQSNSDSRFFIQEGDNMLKIGGVNAGTGVINVINTGNVGIGTTTTGSNKLAVEGTIAARKIKVTQATSWPDFVFDSSYQLPSLGEIKNYVTVNKHLPDVPSAAEIAKNGQDLGEMNRVLLQKVEELTLLLIEQDKRIKALEQGIK